jgi:hypothetical protein
MSGESRTMTPMIKTGAVLAVLLAASGCTSSSSRMSGGNDGPAPLRPAPTGQVASSQLPPPPPPPPPVAPVTTDPVAQPGATPGTPAVGGATQTASSAPVTREGLVGAWKVTSGGGNCQIFMALTKWTGGYRAASRGCAGQVADVSAWDVSGSQVVLKDSSGSTVANLNSSGGTRYDGSTSGGAAISLYR